MNLREYIAQKWGLPEVALVRVDDVGAVGLHRQIIRQNALLMAHYHNLYQVFKNAEERLGSLNFPSLEIGSGGGFLRDFIPDVITSDVVLSEGVDRVEDATQLSFADRSLKAIYASGVLHHISEPQKCFAEIQRVLVPGGLFVCSEPSSTPFGYFMNRHFHNEYTDKTVTEWTIPDKQKGGRLTGANMAIPYMIFKRDRALFEDRFPSLKIRQIIYYDFLRYAISGGLSYRPFMPASLYWAVNGLEKLAKPLMPLLGNGMIVTVEKLPLTPLRM